MLRNIVKNTFFYSLSGQLPTLLNLFLLPFVTKYLTTSDYSTYGLILAYTGLASAFSNLGFTNLFTASYYRDKKNFADEWRELIGFQIVYKFFYGIVVAFIVWAAFPSSADPSDLWFVIGLVVVPVVFFDLLKTIGPRLCQFRDTHEKVYGINILSGLISISISFYTIIYWNAGFKGWLMGQFAASLIQFVFFAHLIYVKEKMTPIFRMKWEKVKANLSVSLPLIPSTYSTYLLSSSDRVLMDWNGVSEKDLGQYNLAYSFAGYFEFINAQVNTVVTPLLYDLYNSKTKQHDLLARKLMFSWLAVNLLIATLLGLWVQNIFQVVYRKEELWSSFPYAIILVFSFCYRPLYVAPVNRALLKLKSRSVMWVLLTSALVNITLNVIGIPLFGAAAATVNSFFGYMMMGILGFYMLKDGVQERVHYRPIRVFLFIIPWTIFIYWVGQTDLIWRLLLSLVVLGIAFYLYRKYAPAVRDGLNQFKRTEMA